MLMAAVALVASCSQDLTNDVTVNPDGNEAVNGVYGGVTVVASVEDVTRLAINGDEVAKKSEFVWEVGDELTIVYDGQAYNYITGVGGRTAAFGPKSEADALQPADVTKPIALFYNVKSVDAAAMTATYDVVAEQVAGQLSNKMPLYSYNATVVLDENNKLQATMKPLASVVELELAASKSWNIDAVSLTRSISVANTYATAEGVVVDAATGAISLDNATVGNEVKVSLGAAVDLATAKNVQLVVMGLTREVTTTETVTNEDQTTTEVTTTDLYAPLYHGKAVLKLYKNGRENARRTIWATYTPGATAVDEHKHIYQPIADVLKDKVADGISTAEQMKAFADAINGTTERYPAGAEFSNEDGVVVLKNNIDLSAYTNWMAIGCNNDLAQHIKPQFAGVFDGGNNTISGLTINANNAEYKLPLVQEDGQLADCVQNGAGLFGVVANGGTVKNLTVQGTIVAAMADPNEEGGYNWSYAAGIVANISGGSVENCVSEVEITGGDAGCGKVRVGGIVGRAYPATADILIKNCTNNGAVTFEYTDGKSHQAVIGGIIGFNGDGSKGFVANVDNCHNAAAVKVFSVGGDSYIGGAIGYCNTNEETAGVVSNCSNSGAVTAGSNSAGTTGMYVGGFVGRQNSHTINKCTNSGAVTLDPRQETSESVSVAGFVGMIYGGADSPAYLNDCHNTGTVTVEGMKKVASIIVGGFVGYPRFICELNGCTNSGNVTAIMGNINGSNWSGGFAGKVGVAATGHKNGVIMNKCKNSGTFTMGSSTTTDGWSYGAGFAGCCYGGTDVSAAGVYGVHLIECENTGLVKLVEGFKTRLGGLSGLCNSSYFLNCKNSGTVAVERVAATGADYVGGIAGQIEGDTAAKNDTPAVYRHAVIEGCVNTGTICSFYKTGRENGTTTSNIYILLGGIAGNGGGPSATIKNCTNTGKLLASHDTNNVWDDAKGNWSVGNGTSKNYQYRAAIVGNPHAKLKIENCKIGGYVGSVKGGDGEDKYTAVELHKLTDVAGDTYYFERWGHGYTKPIYSGCTYIDADAAL